VRLSKVKLAGFKSFVDPTVIALPSNLTGVVGPNGCGKSNVIDAVRWVMGELSARHLRGESMADVVFNGSSSRKPLGNASVELLFDSSDGKIGGAYAGFTELSPKRVVSGDGSPAYSITGGRCRRKDIAHLFLGTGLGSRSYAIIEQGMISRVIEARADDMRAFLEEAAGISLYKERRRETEARIADTRENLARGQDLRDEVDKQIRHLQRQASAARKYQELRTRERLLTADELRLTELRTELTQLSPEVESLRGEEQALLAAQGLGEQRLGEWQQWWEQFNAEQGGAMQTTQVEIARIEQLEAQLLRLRAQADRLLVERDALAGEQGSVSLDELHSGEAQARAAAEQQTQQLAALQGAVQDLRVRRQQAEGSVESLRTRRERSQAELMALEAVQKAALGEKDARASAWLETLPGPRARVAERLSVDAGWERAVETVLGDYLEAVCVEDFESLQERLAELGGCSVRLVENNRPARPAVARSLAAHVQGGPPVPERLSEVGNLASLGQALRPRSQLRVGQSGGTRAGEWVGRG